MPNVSLVIPTRNRSHLLKKALVSALRQTYQDIEIVVSDNYCGNERTKEVCELFNAPKVRYVRTERLLPMPESWEFAVAHARGQYITILTDDSYLLPNALSIVMDMLKEFSVQVAVWRHCGYWDCEWVQAGRRSTLAVPRVTFSSCLLDSRNVLRKFYGNLDDHLTPRFLNSICHRAVIERILQLQGRLFLPPSPDYSSAASVLLNIPRYLFIDQPLLIDGVTASSIGATANFGGTASNDFWEEFDQDPTEIAFLGLKLSWAGIGASLEAVRNYYPGVCPALNKRKLLGAIVNELVKLEANGVNVRGYWEIIKRHLAAQPMSVKLSMAKQRVVSKIRWTALKAIRSSPRLARLEAVRGLDILDGEKAGFDDIEGCANIVMERLYKRSTSSPSVPA